MKAAELADEIGASAGFLAQAMTPLVTKGWVRSEPGLYLISAHNLVRRQALIQGIERTALFQHIDPADHIGNYFVVDLRATPPR